MAKLKLRFFAGLALTLLGLTLIIYFTSIKPVNIPFRRWKIEMGATHVGWMAGSVLCAIGLILIIADAFLTDAQAEAQEGQERELREAIRQGLPHYGMTERELNELINSRYGRTGIVGLNAEQMADLQDLLKQMMAASRD